MAQSRQLFGIPNNLLDLQSLNTLVDTQQGSMAPNHHN